jgi:hypothetical protein
LNGPECAEEDEAVVDAGFAESGCGKAVDSVSGMEGPHVEAAMFARR